MAVVSLKPGTATVQLDARAKSSVLPAQALGVPGGLFPLRASAWEVDEYRIMAGWPVPVPPCDVRIPTLVSATGEVLASREDPGSVFTEAALRWVADPAYYDTDALRWTPIQGNAPVWNTSVGYAPVLIDDYSYRVGEERFNNMTALNFDSDTRNHMWADFTGSVASGVGYTVIMVFSPNSVYGNDVSVPYNGLWCHGGATPAGDTFAEPLPDGYANFTIQGNYLYLETDSAARTRGISISEQLNSAAPTFLAMVIQRPVTTLYAATGPSRMIYKGMASGEVGTALDGRVVLGRSTGDVLHTADMALFDLGIYANALTPAEVRAEFAVLSRVYGGDS